MKLTHIDTGGHGYLSVPVKLIQKLGLRNRISEYSGLSLTRVYLEKDCDAPMLLDELKARRIEYEIKSGYNPKLMYTHQYIPSLLGYAPEIGDMVLLRDNKYYQVVSLNKGITVSDGIGRTYRITQTNPFEYIRGFYRPSGIERLRAGLALVGIDRETEHLIHNWKLNGTEQLEDVIREFKDYMVESL